MLISDLSLLRQKRIIYSILLERFLRRSRRALTITAKASTKHGLLFQYMCGFQRAYGKEDIENSGYGAITINKPFDSLAWAKKNFRKALSEYRRDIDKYQHAIHP
jgi:hypothetical protein